MRAGTQWRADGVLYTAAPAPFLPACRRDATLQLEDLRKYGLADSEALYQVIYSGTGSMPG